MTFSIGYIGVFAPGLTNTQNHSPFFLGCIRRCDVHGVDHYRDMGLHFESSRTADEQGGNSFTYGLNKVSPAIK